MVLTLLYNLLYYFYAVILTRVLLPPPPNQHLQKAGFQLNQFSLILIPEIITETNHSNSDAEYSSYKSR